MTGKIKRFAAQYLVIVLLSVCFSSAFAEKVIHQLSGEELLDETIESLGYRIEDCWDVRTPLLQQVREGKYHIGYEDANCYGTNLIAIRDSGLMHDLSCSAEVQEYVAMLIPELQQLVTTADGQVIGLPRYLSPCDQTLHANLDVFEQAGYTEADIPQSLTELLDFLATWADHVEKNPEKNICALGPTMACHNSMNEKTQYATWLTNLLVTIWASGQAAEGEAISFNMPEFIELAKRCREVGIALWKVEPRTRKRIKMEELFSEYVVVNSTYSDFHYMGQAEGLDWTVPMRINEDEPWRYLVTTSVLYFPGNGLTAEDAETVAAVKAADYIEEASESQDLGYQTPMPQTYEIYNGKTFDPAPVSEKYLADFYAAEKAFEVSVPFGFDTTKSEKAVAKFCEGELSAEDFAAHLDELVEW